VKGTITVNKEESYVEIIKALIDKKKKFDTCVLVDENKNIIKYTINVLL